jgi:hypothetical protein
LLSGDALATCAEFCRFMRAYLSSDNRFIHSVPDIVLSQKANSASIVVVWVLSAQYSGDGKLRYCAVKKRCFAVECRGVVIQGVEVQ